MIKTIVTMSSSHQFGAHFESVRDLVEIISVHNPEDGLRAVATFSPMAVFVSLAKPMSGIALPELIHQIKQICPSTQVIACSKGYDAATHAIAPTIDVVKAGTFDLVELPTFREELQLIFSRITEFVTTIHTAVTVPNDPDMMPIIIDRVLNLLDWKRATASPIAKEELQHLLPLLHDQDAQAIIDAYPVIPIDREFAILSIEDEPLQRENIIDFIEMKYSGTAVGTFSEGLELLQNETFDVVLLDINLPDFYGNHAVSLIKTFSPTTDIIMVTAYRSYELIQEAVRNGAADYIVKPFCFDRVQLAIAHIMQRRALRALIQDRISQPTVGDLS